MQTTGASVGDILGYVERRRTEAGRENRWGVYNLDSDRWLDVHFGSESEARRAAAFLTKARVRPQSRGL
jgi:hypothetical protein